MYFIQGSMSTIYTVYIITIRFLCIRYYIWCEGCSYTYPPLSIARYSFKQLSELEQCRFKKKHVPKVLAPQHRIRIRVFLVESSKLYPSAIALYNV